MSEAWGSGLATVAAEGRVLDVLFPEPRLGRADGPPGTTTGATVNEDARRGTQQLEVTTVLDDLDAAPTDAYDAYLRLHLLSHRLVRPHGISLEGIFGVLPNVAWTSRGPVDPAALAEVRVRLGAHLAEGTTVMHEGFVNYNAGTLGASMVEGRISAGVVVGDGSDIGGGASIMGTLSGGGTQVISVGERCLLGANAGIGIALGDDCVVEAGLYVTAATKVTLPGGQIVKAVELSGQDSLLFLRNSVTGAIEVRPRLGKPVTLNEALHAN